MLLVSLHRRISGCIAAGILVSSNSRPRLIGNELYGNSRAGLLVFENSDPFLSGNTIRDHVGAGVGVYVHHTSQGLATILPDNVFLRNEGGDVVREPAPAPGGGPGEESDGEEGPEGEEASSEEEEGSASSEEWETDSDGGAPDSEEGGEA